MTRPLRFALNRMVAPRLSLPAFLDLAVSLGMDAIELRNDLKGVEIEDGTSASVIREACSAEGLRVLSINALYPFDVWNSERHEQARKLAAYARECGAEALVLCPRNEPGDPRSEAERASGLHTALTELAPILREFGVLGFVEPLGFEFCALRRKRVAVDAIKAVGGLDVYRVVHDTFHHHLSGEQEYFIELTGLVHISGVEDGGVALGDIRDGHRVLVGEGDLLGNAPQLERLLTEGYTGHFSFEPFAESVHGLGNIQQALSASMIHLHHALA